MCNIKKIVISFLLIDVKDKSPLSESEIYCKTNSHKKCKDSFLFSL